MAIQRLTLLASFFLTAVMFILALLFDVVKDQYSAANPAFYLILLASFLILSLANYFVINFLFNYYGKRQIRKISTILPEFLVDDDNLNFQKFGQRVSDLNLKNTVAIDTMKEMALYRKEYIGNVSHELKTPLFTIQGYVDTLLDGGVENLAIRDKYLQRIDRSVERLLNIVKDLDMMNQFESGVITLNISRFDLNQLIREMIELLDLEAQKKNSQFILQTGQSQMWVNADRQKISQVLVNLMTNAIYYANREDAKVIIRTTELQSKIIVEVEDNGMGIKPEMISRIFERFYRVESSRNRINGGSGLGLAIVKHIIEAHQQNINVKSTYLEGAIFSFSLEKAI